MIVQLLRLFRIMIEEGAPRICVLCSRSQGLSELCHDISDLIEQCMGGMLLYDGAAVLLQLRRLPCNRCLGRMLAAKHSISCVSLTATDTMHDGTFCTPTSFAKAIAPIGPCPEEISGDRIGRIDVRHVDGSFNPYWAVYGGEE